MLENNVHLIGRGLANVALCKDGSGMAVALKTMVDKEVKKFLDEKGVAGVRLMTHTRYDLVQISALLQQGQVKPYISTEFSFKVIPEAHKQAETGKTRGKVVITLAFEENKN